MRISLMQLLAGVLALSTTIKFTAVAEWYWHEGGENICKLCMQLANSDESTCNEWWCKDETAAGPRRAKAQPSYNMSHVIEMSHILSEACKADKSLNTTVDCEILLVSASREDQNKSRPEGETQKVTATVEGRNKGPILVEERLLKCDKCKQLALADGVLDDSVCKNLCGRLPVPRPANRLFERGNPKKKPKNPKKAKPNSRSNPVEQLEDCLQCKAVAPTSGIDFEPLSCQQWCIPSIPHIYETLAQHEIPNAVEHRELQGKSKNIRENEKNPAPLSLVDKVQMCLECRAMAIQLGISSLTSCKKYCGLSTGTLIEDLASVEVQKQFDKRICTGLLFCIIDWADDSEDILLNKPPRHNYEDINGAVVPLKDW